MRRGMVVLFLAVILAIGCSSSEPPPSVETFFALYGPQEKTALTPFPSNRYARADAASKSGLRVDIRAETTADGLVSAFPQAIAALNRLDGFSTIGPFLVAFSEDIEEAGNEREIALVDVDPASPTSGQLVPIVTLYRSTDSTSPSGFDHTLYVHPAEPLRPRTRYAMVVRDGLRSKRGAHVRATDSTAALFRDEPGAYAESVRAALPIVEKALVTSRDSLVLATVFTTASVHDVVASTGAAVRAAPAPTMASPFVLKGAAGDKRALFSGKINAPEYRRAKPVGTWDVQGETPIAQRTAALEAYLVFSSSARSGPRPVVVYAHALAGDKEGAWDVAERLAALDVAVIAIDAPEHGSRSDPPTPDGRSDIIRSVAEFFAVDPAKKTFDMERVRDNFRQAAFDLFALVRFVEAAKTLDLLPIGDPDGVPDLDTTQILFLGNSFGSVMASTAGALAPEIRAASLCVGGGGILTLVRDSGLAVLAGDSFRPPGAYDGEIPKVLAILQSVVDQGDPANFARFMTVEAMPGVPAWRAKDVLIQQVEGDTIVPNLTGELLGRAAKLSHVGPVSHDIPHMTHVEAPMTANLPSGATGGLSQFATLANGAAAEHGTLIFTREATRQTVEFFRTALAGRGTIVDPQAN